MTRLRDEWAKLEPFLAVTERKGKQKAMLLIFWDEARALIERKVGNDAVEPRLVNLFIIIRRVIRKIGREGDGKAFPMFHIFTDTTPRISNVQPHGATDSSRLLP
jgi:hypothetical protein